MCIRDSCTIDAEGEVHPVEQETMPSELVLGTVATAAGVAGLGLAGFMYLGGFPWERRRQSPTLAWKASRNKFFVDEIYQFLFTGLGKAVAATAAFVIDRRVIDGTVSRIAHGVGALAVLGRKLQTGLVRSYAVGVLGGVVVLGILLVARAR